MYTAIELPELTSRAQAESYAQSVCFRSGPPALIGAELEFLSERTDIPGARPTPAMFATALGAHSPKSIDPSSPAQALPGGGLVTVEPGGQAEIASAPHPTTAGLCAALRTDVARLQQLLGQNSITLVDGAADPARPAELVQVTPRYEQLWALWEREGKYGKQMAANTAATQVSVDAGAGHAEMTARWNALYAIGPALSAAFACSPALHGLPADGWASQRMRTWLASDPARVLPPVWQWSDPVTEYSTWVLDAPLLCVRRDNGDWSAPANASFADWVAGRVDDEIGRRPTLSDLDYHLTMVHPPVRAQGHFEVRYIDAQPGGLWTVPIYTIGALTSSPQAVAQAYELARDTADSWWAAAQLGLADPALRETAVALFELAAAHAEDAAAAAELTAAARRCHAGRAPGQ